MSTRIRSMALDGHSVEAEHYPGIPKASPQSIRSRRAELVRKGLVHASGLIGYSEYGRRATVWELARLAA